MKVKPTKEVLISMTNLLVTVRATEEALVANDLSSFRAHLLEIQRISAQLHGLVDADEVKK